MALTRKLLKGMGLTDEQVETIIEAHTESTDGLKSQLTQYKTDAEKLPGVQKELDDLKAAGGGYKEKYEAEKTAHEEYKQKIAAEKAEERDKADIYAMAREAGVERESFLNMIQKIFDRSKIQRSEDGAVSNRAELVNAIRAENPDCIATTSTIGTPPVNPPSGGKSNKSMTRDEIMSIKDTSERQRAIAENLDLFGK